MYKAQKKQNPVLVLPGFLTSDFHMAVLRGKIGDAGYKVYGWDYGYNLGPDKKLADYLRDRLRKIFEENGRQKVAIVGYSLGGVYARELARAEPHMVSHVITLGSPFVSKSMDKWQRDLYTAFHGAAQGATAQLLPTPPPGVPTTSIYSKNDYIVPWSASINPGAPLAENIEVKIGHVYLHYDDGVAAIILDRLAQPQKGWKPYKP